MSVVSVTFHSIEDSYPGKIACQGSFIYKYLRDRLDMRSRNGQPGPQMPAV